MINKSHKLTPATTVSQIKRDWHQVDVADQVLGRVATKIALLLVGKSKPYFVRHLDCGDYVVVTNATKVKVTGKKVQQKIYTTYSGYPGGLRKEKFGQMLERKPEEIIRRAVLGMLPNNKLRDQFMKRLYIYKSQDHPYTKNLAAKG